MTGKRKSTSRKLPPTLKKHPTTQRLIDTHDSDETLPPSQFISDEPIVFDGWRQVSRQVSRQILMINKQRNLDAATNNRPILPNERRSAGGFQSNKQAPLSCTDNSLTPRPRANDIDAARNFMEDDNDSQLPNIESSATVSGILPRSTIVRGLYKGVDLDKLTNEKKKKLIVFIPPGKYISPIGEHERKLASWLGYCARSVGPPIESWRKVEKDKGLLLFKMVKDYFDISPESPEKWKKLEEKGDVKPDTPEMKQAKFS